MSFDAFDRRVASIVAAPPELAAYQRWLAERPAAAKGERDYLFAKDSARFEPRQQDVLVATAGLQVRKRGGGLKLTSAEPPAELALAGVAQRDAERILTAIDGERCLLEVRWQADVEQSALARFLRAAFGLLLFAPEAVDALEARLSGIEIVRFPSAPYAIERCYWQNMIDVRERLAARSSLPVDGDGLLELLRELHVLALMGRDLDSFYKPASPGADDMVGPGSLFLAEPRLLSTSGGTIFVSGPRVNASMIGGEGYHRALYASVGDPEAAAERSLTMDGLQWGRVVVARSHKDAHAGPWFCPPRPIEAGHFDYLCRQLHAASAAAEGRDEPQVVRAAARFHWAFARLHPFHCANQCVAMNIVNHLIARLRGVGIPHLVLDHLALRLTADGYEQAFARAVTAFGIADEDAARRLGDLQQRKQRAFWAIERASAAADDDQLEAALEADPSAAQFALLR